MLRVSLEAIRVVDRAAAKEGLSRFNFMLQAIGAAVKSSTGEHFPEDRPSSPGEDIPVT